MKSKSGNTHQNKKLVGISKSSSEMENERMSKGAMYQQKYWKKIEQTNRTNAEFMQYTTEHCSEVFGKKSSNINKNFTTLLIV